MARPKRTYDLEKKSPPSTDLEVVGNLVGEATLKGVNSGFKKGLLAGLVVGIIVGYLICIAMAAENIDALDIVAKLLKLIIE